MKFFFILLSICFLFPLVVFASVSSAGVGVSVQVNNCDNSGICDISNGENFSNCQNDCPAACNDNGTCEANLGENSANCPNDCVVVPSTTVSNSGGGSWSLTVPLTTVLNVINLSAQAQDSAVILYWEVPNPSNYGGVLIRRSEIFSPVSVSDGGILYQGLGDSIGLNTYSLKDINLQNGQWYFYTIFLFDKNGNYSSGASVSGLPQSAVMEEPFKTLLIPPQKLTPELSIPLKLSTTTLNKTLENNFNFFQNVQLIVPGQFGGSGIKLNPAATTTIIIEKKNIPENTKAITATIDDGRNIQTLFFNKENNGDFVLVIPGGSFKDNSRISFTFISPENNAIIRTETAVNTQNQSLPIVTSTYQKSEPLFQRLSSSILDFVMAVDKFISGILQYLFVIINIFKIRILEVLGYWVYILKVLVVHK